ncbi:MAG: transglutaminase domain-containing protein [Lachnospiraceae bacterium oral taxon 082]|nr:transglutaminase domain-containing protein [Lachnospiraceae bacterium oral taxon 082]
MNSRKEKEPKRLLKRATALSVTLLLSTGSLFTSVAATGPEVEQISFENKTGIISEEPKTTNVSQYSYDTNIDYRIEMNSSERYPKSIYISGKLLGIDKIPVISIYKYIWLILKDSNGKEVYNNIVSNSTGSISFYLDKIAEGKYSVNLYASSERYGSYKSLIYGNDIEILYKDGKLSFVPYPYYDHNMAVVNNKRTDEKALAYYRQPSSDIQSDNQEIIDLANSITAGITNDYDKAVAIHDWVCNNIYYDWDSYSSKNYTGMDTSALGTLHSKRSVCDGYSNLTAALLRAAGVPAKKISGFALGVSNDYWPENFDPNKDTNHAWNEFWANGRWVILDTTWDSDNAWRNGGIEKNTGLRGYHYFDINVGLLSADHVIKDYNEADVPQP